MILTRCPGCQKVFHVSPAQLRARQGRVRCGACGTAFNALATLVEGEEEVSKSGDEKIKAVRRPIFWMMGTVALSLTLLTQALYFWRSDIALYYPPVGQVMKSLCTYIGCTVPQAVRPDLMKIEYAVMRPSPTANGRYIVDVTLRNDANFPQPPPMLEVALTDAQNQVLARRVFAPEEYLQNTHSSIMPASRLELQLNLDATGLPGIGFQVYTFYP